MTNTIIAIVSAQLLTNWVQVENKQIGVLVEVRSVEIEGKKIELSRTIIDQHLIRDASSPISVWLKNGQPPSIFWTPNLNITNLSWSVK